MSAQRARSSVAADHRSAHPNLPGVPWWGAILIAVAACAAGFAFDAGSANHELTNVFAAMYVIGCVAAVLAVRQSGVFTAVVQPPLILFVAVPSAYYLFHHSEIQGVKDILINCGYPLIERFLLMFSTTVLVLLIGMARWYFGAASRSRTATPGEKDSGAGSAVRTKLSSLFGGAAGDENATDVAEPSPRKHAIDRPATAERPARRPAKRPAPTRSRHARPPVDDLDDPPPAPRRSRRPSHNRDVEPRLDPDDASPPRRRPRTPRDPGARNPTPREYRRDQRDRAEPYERPTRRSSRYEGYEPPEPYDASAPPPVPRRRPAPSAGTNNPTGTHHPVSKVRYRGDATGDGGEQHIEYRSRPRGRHSIDSDRWRYEP